MGVGMAAAARDDAGAAALTTAAVGFEFLSSVRF
jgi:hypothetical protein